MNLVGQGLKRSSTESADVDDDVYLDGIVCTAAEFAIDDLARSDNPFFLAVGFRKPHLPFCAPEKYWDLYERDHIPLPEFASHPIAAPELAIRSWKELEGYSDISKDGQLTEQKIQELRHGYYACVSYVDALVGRLLANFGTQRSSTTPLSCCGVTTAIISVNRACGQRPITSNGRPEFR